MTEGYWCVICGDINNQNQNNNNRVEPAGKGNENKRHKCTALRIPIPDAFGNASTPGLTYNTLIIAISSLNPPDPMD